MGLARARFPRRRSAEAGVLAETAHTRGRDANLEVIRESAGPLTTREIHERGRSRVPGAGIASVSRTIGLLPEAEQVRSASRRGAPPLPSALSSSCRS